MTSRARVVPNWVLALALVSLLVLGGAAYAYAEGLPPFAPSDDTWHAVFLTNGQTYFGHFYAGPGDYARLRDVHYVTTQIPAQAQQQSPAPPQLVVLKLGGEVHGPRSEMKIARSAILFLEDLRPDSPVVQAIIKLRASQK